MNLLFFNFKLLNIDILSISELRYEAQPERDFYVKFVNGQKCYFEITKLSSNWKRDYFCIFRPKILNSIENYYLKFLIQKFTSFNKLSSMFCLQNNICEYLPKSLKNLVFQYIIIYSLYEGLGINNQCVPHQDWLNSDHLLYKELKNLSESSNIPITYIKKYYSSLTGISNITYDELYNFINELFYSKETGIKTNIDNSIKCLRRQGIENCTVIKKLLEIVEDRLSKIESFSKYQNSFDYDAQFLAELSIFQYFLLNLIIIMLFGINLDLSKEEFRLRGDSYLECVHAKLSKHKREYLDWDFNHDGESICLFKTLKDKITKNSNAKSSKLSVDLEHRVTVQDLLSKDNLISKFNNINWLKNTTNYDEITLVNLPAIDLEGNSVIITKLNNEWILKSVQ